MESDKSGLFEELKRRHVVRVAIAYAIAAWLLVQIATQVFPFFNIPGWAVRLIVVLVVIGFPVAVIGAWVFELTPEGIRRTAPADAPDARPEHENRQIGRKLNVVIVAVLILAVALLGWRLYAVRHAKPSTLATAAPTRSPDGAQRNPGNGAARNPGNAIPDSAAAAAASGLHNASANASPLPASTAAAPEKSVAVLPFANESGNKDEQFFSDGLSEDLITALSQFAGLKVISRNSAFQFRDSKDSSAQIGKLLGVAHLLEGSVQRARSEVRITATLVNAADGSILWSQRYDKPYKDLFALQDDITEAVADALKAKLLATSGAVVQSDRPPSGNLDAYAAYLRGVADFKLQTQQGLRDAVEDFGQATRLDPRYAMAYAQSSRMWTGLANQYLSGRQAQQVYAEARHAASRALALDPDLALAHLARADVLLTADLNWEGAEAEAQHAVQLAPNDAYAKFFLGSILATLGQTRRAVDLTRQALQADPRHANWYQWSSVYLAAQDHLVEAAHAADAAIALQSGAAAYHEQVATVEILRDDAPAALAAAQREPSEIWRTLGVALALQIGPDRKAADAALQKLIADHAGDAAYQIAEVYALRRDPDNVFKWLVRAWRNRDPGISGLLYDPIILRYRHDPRFAAFCKKVGLPTTTDAVAMK